MSTIVMFSIKKRFILEYVYLNSRYLDQLLKTRLHTQKFLDKKKTYEKKKSLSPYN